MIRLFNIVWHDPTLRLVVYGMLLFGAFVAGSGIFQSLIAITVYGMSDGGYTLVLICALVVTVAASVGVGIVTDQRASRWIMAMAASATLALGGALMLLANDTTAFIIVAGILFPVSGTLFGQLFAVARLVTLPMPRADRDGILAIIRAAFAVPFMVGTPLFGLMFDLGLPLVGAYGFALLFGLCLLVLVSRHWPRDAVAPWTEQKSGLSFRASIGELLRPDVLTRVMLMGAIQSGTALSGVILALVFDEASGRGTTDLGLFFALFVGIEIIVTLLIGQIRRLMRRLYIIAIGVFTFAAYLFLLPFVAESQAVWLLVIPAGVGGALIYALSIGYLQDLLGARAGAGASLIAIQRIASDGLCAIIFGIGSWLYGYGLAAGMAAVTIVVAMLAVLWLDRHSPLEP